MNFDIEAWLKRITITPKKYQELMEWHEYEVSKWNWQTFKVVVNFNKQTHPRNKLQSRLCSEDEKTWWPE